MNFYLYNYRIALIVDSFKLVLSYVIIFFKYLFVRSTSAFENGRDNYVPAILSIEGYYFFIVGCNQKLVMLKDNSLNKVFNY